MPFLKDIQETCKLWKSHTIRNFNSHCLVVSSHREDMNRIALILDGKTGKSKEKKLSCDSQKAHTRHT